MRACVLLLALVGVASAQLVIESAERKIDGSGFAVPVQTKLKIRNDGQSAAAGVVLCEPLELASRRALIEVLADNDASKRLQSKPASPEGAEGAACEEWALPSPLGKGKSAELAVVAVYSGVLTPKPAAIPPTEPQRVVFEAPLYLLSPYKVESQSATFEAGTSNIEQYTEDGSKKGRTVSFGPYENVAPWSAAGEPLRVHYENNAPFAQATSVEREIEISHWGNVYFEDRYDIRHAGARASGEWSRLDYMTRPNFGPNAIRELTAVLPPAANSLYYRDEIGNISTSAARFSRGDVTVQLAPRYPLFGGWSSTFKFGWSLPLGAAVGRLPSGKVVLRTPLGPAAQGLVVDELTVKVVLPEGATGVDVDVPLPMEQALERKYTYLDVMGRTVVVLRARNLVPQQAALPLQVEYAYSSMGLLQKPLVLVAALGSLFGLALALGRSASGGGGDDDKEKTA